MADSEASPRLRAVIDSVFASIKPGLDLGTLSVYDSYDPQFGTYFEPDDRIGHIVSQSKFLAAQVPKPVHSHSGSSSRSLYMYSFVLGRSSSFESVP